MINFDEYIRQGEPQQREKGYAWQTAIGLQAVDGLKPSDYLIETARKDIEGEITIDEAVLYVSASDICKAIEYDLEQERLFDYSKVDRNGLVSHIAKFVSGLWQIHPFGEGNTRTIAVFTILYLRSMGFDVTNDLFANYSWYFRNALVRANYRNVKKGIMRNFEYLERFFRNLLLGESNALRNRYMVVDVPKELGAEQAQHEDRTSNRTSSRFAVSLVK
mgnify:CR=1 FL=1